MWITKKKLKADLVKLTNAYEEHLKLYREEIKKQEEENRNLWNSFAAERKERKDAIKYLEYVINNPPKYKLWDKVKTFVVWDREYKHINNKWQHGYTLKCTLTDKVTEKFFSESEIDKIKKQK